eukprot:g1333.t1
MSSFSGVFGKANRKRKKKAPLSIFDKSEAYVRNVTPTPAPLPKKPKRKPPLEAPEEAQSLNQETRTIFVGNLSLSIKKLPKKLTVLFKKFGEVESVRLRSVPSIKGDNAPKRIIAQNRRFQDDAFCNAYVVFKDSASINDALRLNMTLFHGFHIRVNVAAENGFQQSLKNRVTLPGQFAPAKSVFVRNVCKEASDEEFMKLFNDGALLPLCKSMVKNWRIVRDHKTGISKGYGFVSFHSASAAKAAFALNGHSWKNSKLSIEKLAAPENKSRKESRGNRTGKRTTEWGGIHAKKRFKSRRT